MTRLSAWVVRSAVWVAVFAVPVAIVTVLVVGCVSCLKRHTRVGNAVNW